MHKPTETFHGTNGYKKTICGICVTFFKRYLHESEGLAYIYFSYENESLHHCLSCDSRQMVTFLVLEVQFFQRVRLQGGSRYGF